MIQLKLKRKKYTDKQVIGNMDVYKDNIFVCSFATLEQEWNNNETSNSCIPPDFYKVKHYNSQSHPNSFIIENTEPRTYILIHSGNYNTHTAGCILIGAMHKDINNDKYQDVINSKDSMNYLNRICENENVISIEIN